MDKRRFPKLLVCLALLLCLAPMAMAAEEPATEALTAALSTAQDGYPANEEFALRLTVTNPTDVNAENVRVQFVLPETLTLRQGELTPGAFALAAGESRTLQLTVVKPAEEQGAAATPQPSAEQPRVSPAENPNASPVAETGDTPVTGDPHSVLGFILLALLGLTALVLAVLGFRRWKIRGLFALLLCAALLGTGLMPRGVQAKTVSKSLTAEKTLTVAGETVEVKADISYDQQEAEAVANGIENIFSYSDGSSNGMADFIGANFINPRYGFGEDAVAEGAQRLRTMGSKSIKFYLSPNYKTYYEPYTDFGEYSSPVELAQDPSFRAMMDMDFNTFFIGAYVFANDYATYWKDSLTPEQKQAEYDAMYDLTYYLCTQYAGTNKTFILQNWEGDWSCMDVANPATDPGDEVFQRMIEWTNIRQDAVNDARRDANQAGVRVYHALEVNLLDKAMKGGKTVANNVIPYTYCDYYSYSAYDTESDPEKFAAALDYLREKAQNNLIPGKSRIYVGEFGLPENEFGTKSVMNVVKSVTEICRAKGIDYILYWQLYDNEVYDPSVSVYDQTDKNCRGYWLIKPSGRKTDMWNYFYKLINGEDDPEFVAQEPEKSEYAQLEITLGETNDCKGLTQKDAADGVCTATEIGGKPCRVTPAANPNLYMYFNADDDYLTEEDRHLEVTFTYYDNGTAPIVLEYWNQNNALASQTVLRTGTDTWLTATLRLSDAKFDNGFHGGFADFRFSDYNEPLYVHYVKVNKWTPGGTSGVYQAGAGGDQEDGVAVTVLGDIADGVYLRGNAGGKDYISGRAGEHLRFDISPDVCSAQDRNVYIDVEYFDNQSDGGFVLYYTDGSDSIVKETPAVMFTGTNTWLTHRFTLTDAQFDNLWYGLADFSIISSAHPVPVHAVSVSTPVQERTKVSIVLSGSPIEDGIGMKTLAYDGMYTVAEKQGKACIATDAASNASGDAMNNYIYFNADDAFIPADQQELWVTLTYFDEGTGEFEFQYNSTSSDEGPDYLGLCYPYVLTRTGTGEWVTTTFKLDNAQFDNKLQGGLADFRLNDKGEQLFVSKISIQKTDPDA